MKAQPRVFECSRFVLLEEEVTDPGKTVSDYEGHEDVGESEGEENGSEQLEEGEYGSDEVQSSVDFVAVLRHVERIELVKSLVLLVHK